MFKKESGFDKTLDEIDYQVSKKINFKKIVKEKGWEYAKKTTRKKQA